MIDLYYFGDFDVFVNGSWYTRWRGVTYSDVLDLTWPIERDHPDFEVEIRICNDGD